MAHLGLVKIDSETGRLIKKQLSFFELLSKDRFTKIPEIEKWTNEEIADAFGWRTPEIVGTWYMKTSEKKELG